MNKKFKLFSLIFFLLACTSYIPPKYDFNVYQDNEKSYDLEFYWNVDKKISTVSINGLIKNVRYYDIRSFLLDIELFDDKNSIIAKGVFDYRHDKISPDEIIPFSINLPYNTHSNLKKIKFSYRYYFTEENKFTNDLIYWSFERNITK